MELSSLIHVLYFRQEIFKLGKQKIDSEKISYTSGNGTFSHSLERNHFLYFWKWSFSSLKNKKFQEGTSKLKK